jgi:ribosome-associated translation inhibitor RaiA
VDPSLAPCAASTVKIIVQGRHMTVTPAMKEYTESKVSNAIHNFSGIIREASHCIF